MLYIHVHVLYMYMLLLPKAAQFSSLKITGCSAWVCAALYPSCIILLSACTEGASSATGAEGQSSRTARGG